MFRCHTTQEIKIPKCYDILQGSQVSDIGQKSKDWKALEETEVNAGEAPCFPSHLSSPAPRSHCPHVDVTVQPDQGFSVPARKPVQRATGWAAAMFSGGLVPPLLSHQAWGKLSKTSHARMRPSLGNCSKTGSISIYVTFRKVTLLKVCLHL